MIGQHSLDSCIPVAGPTAPSHTTPQRLCFHLFIGASPSPSAWIAVLPSLEIECRGQYTRGQYTCSGVVQLREALGKTLRQE